MSTEQDKTSPEQPSAPKKTGLADAAKRLLEQKKQAQAGSKGQKLQQSTETQKLKSQMTKKINNQKRRTGV